MHVPSSMKKKSNQKVNVHGGCDSWSEPTAAAFLADAVSLLGNHGFLRCAARASATRNGSTRASKDALPIVGPSASSVSPLAPVSASFETHRGRCLFNPHATLRLLGHRTSFYDEYSNSLHDKWASGVWVNAIKRSGCGDSEGGGGDGGNAAVLQDMLRLTADISHWHLVLQQVATEVSVWDWN